jgi:hypothetical protein
VASILLVSLQLGNSRLQVTTMPATPAKETESNREEIDDHTCAPPAITPVTARKFAASLHGVPGQSLQTEPVFTARSKRRSSGVRKMRRAKAISNHCPPETYRRKECTTVLSAMVQPNVARSARESLASSDTTLGRPLSAPRGALTDSSYVERTTGDSCLVFRPLNDDRGENPAAISGSPRFPGKEIAQ